MKLRNGKEYFYDCPLFEVKIDFDHASKMWLQNKIKIGNYVHIGAYTLLHSGGGRIIVENYAGLSAGVKVFTAQDDYSGKYYVGPFNKKADKSLKKADIVLKKYSSVNTNTVITPYAKIGEGCVVGANTIVNSALGPWKIYYGFPLRAYSRRSKKFLSNFKKTLK